MEKTYDALLIPTGETSFGDRTFPVSTRAAELYRSGRFGCIFVTGGYNGLANIVPGKTINESEDTRNFLLEQGIPDKVIYTDSQSLDTLGNFTFPIVARLDRNPCLLDFEKMLLIGKEGHLWRVKDCAEKVLPLERIDYEAVPGEHNNGAIAKAYHKALMHALRHIKEPSPELAHEFLINNHPFYSEGWYNKSPSRRKVETMAVGLGWFLR